LLTTVGPRKQPKPIKLLAMQMCVSNHPSFK
jgi:hypothetical protein